MASDPERTVGVGIVGLSANGGWAAGAHLPALAAVDGFAVRAVAASSPQSARAAAQAHGVPAASDSVEELAGRDDVDLVVVSVKVPRHRELVLPALAAGKAVLCEWPLAAGLDEVRELVGAATGVRSFVGVQGRFAPAVRYLRDLVADGYVGEVLSTTLVGNGGVWGPVIHPGGEYLLDRDLGATMLTIPFGHTADALTSVLGEFADVVATTATRRPQVRNAETGAAVPMTAEDQIAVSGTLVGGAVASIHLRGGTPRGTGFLWEINGTDGDLQVTSSTGSLNYGQITILGSQGGEPLAELTTPASYDAFPALAGQPAAAVAHAYAQIGRDLAEGTTVAPDFTHALRRHELLDAVARSAATGRRVEVPEK
ncbi:MULTISPECIES: Gfo/Idh/MocA family protein [Frankia]|nr:MULTISPECIES: Gfo/Idh/MocA family oxidoreductase [Frankia]